MTADGAFASWLDAIRDDVRDVVRQELRGIAQPRLMPIKQAPVSYRAILAAEKAGELTIHRRGKSAFVDVDDLDRWIRAAGKAVQTAEPADEIAELITLNRRRRAG